MATTVQPRAAPARRCAFAVVRRVFEQGAYADRALRAEADRARLDARDRALATRLAYGTVQRRATLDHFIATLADRSPEELDPPVLAALRLGLFQLCFMDAIPAHAAVDESVELAKGARGGGHRLVNAVLRRAARECPALPEDPALRHSHPAWVARMWREAFGPDEAEALMASDNEPAESAVRINTLVADDVALDVPSRPAPQIPEGRVLDAPYDVHGSALWERGAIMPQSRASMLVARIVDPRPGERVLDLCAAPGGKTTHLAALMRDEGALVAVERNLQRARALEETCRRMRATIVAVETTDAGEPRTDGPFDRVLVDPPCSALGTLQSRPDARWRATEERVDELAEVQARILDAGLAALKPGGVLVYSTCTLSPRENERQVEAALRRHADIEADDLQPDHPMWKHPTVDRHLLTLPHRDGTDGFFIARLRRGGAP